jgi:hypothetical protein
MKIANLRSIKLLNLVFGVIAIALVVNVVRITVPRLKVYAGLTAQSAGHSSLHISSKGNCLRFPGAYTAWRNQHMGCSF